MQPKEVERMLGKVDDAMTTGEELSEPFIVGENVKIVDGPFKNFEGTIEELNLEKKKLKVIVKIFIYNSSFVFYSYGLPYYSVQKPQML